MSRLSDSEFPGLAAEDDAAGAGRAVRLDMAGYERAQQAALGSGTQHNYFAGAQATAEAAVSIALPAGQRDERFPLRGREQLLNQLLAGSDGHGVRVLHGIGGCGKTSLALEAASRARQVGVEVWWVSAGDERRLLAGLRALSRHLGVTDDELLHGEAADLMWRRLSERERGWLLVIDNADDPQVLAGPGAATSDGTGWLRPTDSPAGRVLVTTRDGRAGSWGPWCSLYPVGMLDASEAARVLADRTRAHHNAMGGDTDAEALAQRLGRLPLALRIAGSFLAESAAVPAAFADQEVVRTYRGYQEVIKRGNLDTAFPAPADSSPTPDQARGVIGRTWELTLELLETRQLPEARRLLRLLACLADAPVPHEVLLHPPILACSAIFSAITGPRVWQILQTLAGFGLIDLTTSVGEVPGVARLHPLVRDTSRPSEPAELTAYLALAASLLGRAAASDGARSSEDPEAWPLWQTLAPHALHVFETLTAGPVSYDEVVAAAAYAACAAANFQAARGLLAAAEATSRAVLEIRLEALGSDHPDTVDARYAVARRMAERADYAHAQAEYSQVLEARLASLGPEHVETLTTRHNIAALMSFQGHYAGAEAEYRRVLAVKLPLLGNDHPDTLATRHEVARMAAELGRYAEAEAEFREVLVTKLRVLAPDHPDTLVTRSQIARVLAAQGHHGRAESEYRDVLATQLRLLGPEHPRVLWTRNEIARMMLAQGDQAGAVAEFRDVLAARQRILGPAHPSTAATEREIKSLASRKDGSASVPTVERRDNWI